MPHSQRQLCLSHMPFQFYQHSQGIWNFKASVCISFHSTFKFQCMIVTKSVDLLTWSKSCSYIGKTQNTICDIGTDSEMVLTLVISLICTMKIIKVSFSIYWVKVSLKVKLLTAKNYLTVVHLVTLQQSMCSIAGWTCTSCSSSHGWAKKTETLGCN